MCKKLFESLETTIRNEQLYAALNLMREDDTVGDTVSNAADLLAFLG